MVTVAIAITTQVRCGRHGSWLKQTIVCHERTDERRCDAVPEMRVGPSEPAVRSRLQTTASCDGQEPWC
jgi:hypothetical protein